MVNFANKLQHQIRGWFPKAPNMPTAENLPTSNLVKKRMFFPVAGGILTVVGSFAVLFMGLLQLIPFTAYSYFTITQYLFNNSIPFFSNITVFPTLFVALVSIFCFAFSFKAGKFAMKRQRFRFSVAGPILLLLAVSATMLLIGLTTPVSVIPTLRFELPVAVLSIVGLIFVRVSRKEFTQYGGNC